MKNNIKSIIEIFNQLDYVLTEQQKKRSIVILICMVISSLLELLGVSVIYPFLEVLTTPNKLTEKWYIKWIYNINPEVSTNQVLMMMGMAIILVFLLKNGFMIFSSYVQIHFAAKCQREISTYMLDTFMKRPYEFFLNTNSGDIYRGITKDVSGVYQIILNIFTLITELITIICLAIYLIMADYIMAIGAIILASLCFLSIVGGFKGAMKKAGQQERKALGLVNKYGYQAINGIKEITVLGRRENFVEQYNSAALIRQKSTLTNSFLSACPDRILEGVCLGGFIGIVCIRIISGAELDNFIPLLGTFAMAAFKILPSISKVSTRINSLVFYRPYLQGVYDNMMSSRKYEEEMKEYKKTHTNQSMVDIDEDQLLGFKYSLKINNISWKYQNTEYNVLEHTNLSINKGESVALIGSSGAGKSTLADIIMGLFRPQKGTVEMDGIDIYTIPQQWTKIIGYVPQSVFLIDDTIRRNVAFGLEDKDIDEGKIWHALEQAQLKDFVSGLPNGLDTIVGERGVKFSGGQRQRVAIARALYENPDILVLDEATSALDNETEQAVMESIDALQGSKTLIIVAHRLTTIRNCDKIYEVKDGKIELCEKEEVLGVN